MARLGMLPTVALLALAGAALGAHFGQATVDSINPFYASDPSGTTSYAALTPQGVSDATPRDVAYLAGADQGWGTGCIGCVRPSVGDRPVFDDDETLAAAPVSSAGAALEADYPVYEVETDADTLGDERRLVQLYAHYPVSQEERDAHHAAVTATLDEAETRVEDGLVETAGSELID